MSRLISEEYREQNRILHDQYKVYGANSAKWLPQVTGLCSLKGARSVLDYGCGKGGLVRALKDAGMDAKGFDPAVEEYAAAPEPADVVVCTDVLEHIEPEYVDGVLYELDRLTIKAIYLIVSTRPAKKMLSDGRNAHLSIHDSRWWLQKLLERFKPLKFDAATSGFMAAFEK